MAHQCAATTSKSLHYTGTKQKHATADVEFVTPWLQQCDLKVSGTTCPAFNCYYDRPREPQLCCCRYQLPPRALAAPDVATSLEDWRKQEVVLKSQDAQLCVYDDVFLRWRTQIILHWFNSLDPDKHDGSINCNASDWLEGDVPDLFHLKSANTSSTGSARSAEGLCNLLISHLVFGQTC